MQDRPVKFTVSVEVTVNSSDGSRQDALDHLEQMIAWHGLAGIQMGAIEPVLARIVRSGPRCAEDTTFTLTTDLAEIRAQAR